MCSVCVRQCEPWDLQAGDLPPPHLSPPEIIPPPPLYLMAVWYPMDGRGANGRR